MKIFYVEDEKTVARAILPLLREIGEVIFIEKDKVGDYYDAVLSVINSPIHFDVIVQDFNLELGFVSDENGLLIPLAVNERKKTQTDLLWIVLSGTPDAIEILNEQNFQCEWEFMEKGPGITEILMTRLEEFSAKLNN